MIKHNKPLKSNDPQDAELISKTLEKSDEEEEDEDFKLYLSTNEETVACVSSGGLTDEHHVVTAAIYKNPSELTKTQVKKAFIYDSFDHNRIQIRSQMRNENAQLSERLRGSEDEIREIEDRNDPPDKLSENEEEPDDEDEESDDGNQNQVISKAHKKPTVIDIQTFKRNITETRDLLLCKDDITYFTDTNGTCLPPPPCKGNFDRHTRTQELKKILGEEKQIKFTVPFIRILFAIQLRISKLFI